MSFIEHMAERERVNVPYINAKYHRIIEADHASNYVGDLTVEDAKIAFDIYKLRGGKFYASATSLVIYAVIGDEVEFHTMNAGTGADLVKTLVAFFESIKAKISIAYTFFDNEKVLGLFKHSPYRVALERVDRGPDKTYQAVIFLREVRN